MQHESHTQFTKQRPRYLPGSRRVAMCPTHGARVIAHGLDEWLACIEYVDDHGVIHCAIGKTGERGIKPGVWYRAQNWQLVECAS